MTPGSIALLSILAGLLVAPMTMAQIPTNTAQPAGSGVQAQNDVRNKLVVAGCRKPLPPPPHFGGFVRRGPGPFPYRVKAIPGVIAAGRRWKLIWTHNGNNADGIVATPDGSILAAQNDRSDVVKITPDGKTTVVYRDTDTGGALAQNKQGDLYIVERSLIPSVWELAPKRRLIADSYMGEPLECQGFGIMDAVVALHTGGVYFGYGGEYYAEPDGTVVKVFDRDVNGIILSPDESKLYMGSGGKLYEANVGSDGRLSHTHAIATIPGGGNDGATVDADGRIYVSGYPGVRVFDADGRYLGTIPAPRNLISLAFAGPDKKTLFAVAFFNEPGTQGFDQIYTIRTIAQGYLGRAK